MPFQSLHNIRIQWLEWWGGHRTPMFFCRRWVCTAFQSPSPVPVPTHAHSSYAEFSNSIHGNFVEAPTPSLPLSFVLDPSFSSFLFPATILLPCPFLSVHISNLYCYHFMLWRNTTSYINVKYCQWYSKPWIVYWWKKSNILLVGIMFTTLEK